MIAQKDIVKKIREALQDGQTDQAELQALASSYANLCERLVKKTGFCRNLLNTGDRGRALRLANKDGSLREEFEQLDFVEAPNWCDLCERLELPLPPILDSEAIRSLIDELYKSGGDNYEHMLRAHRRMALGLAPLADRLRKMREILPQLLAKDEWACDIRAMEAARLEEMARTVERANKERDLETLESVLGELKAKGWLEPPPSRFVAAVEKIVLPHRQRQADKRYRELLEQVHAAHNGMDEPACRAAMADWDAIAQETGCAPSDDLAAQVSPAQAWLAELESARREEEAFERACAELEQGLDGPAGQAELEKLASAILRFEREMPPLLAARFNSRLGELKDSARRRFVVRLTAILAAVVLLATGATMATMWYGKQQTLARWQEQIESAISSRDLEGAGNLLDRMSREEAELFASAGIQGLFNRHAEAVRIDQARRSMFLAAMQKVEASWEEKLPIDGSPVEQEKEAEVEAKLNSTEEKLTTIENDLAGAEKEAASYQEKLLVQDWKAKVEERHDRIKSWRTNRFTGRLETLEGVYARVKEAHDAGQEEFDGLARDCTEMARKLLSSSDVPETLRAPVTRIVIGTVDMQKDFREKQAERQRMQQAYEYLTGLYHRPQEFEKELRAFAEKYPGHPAAKDCLASANMTKHWQASAAWERVVRDCRPFLVSDAESAKKRLAAIEEFLKAHPASPHEAAALHYRDYVKVAEQAWSEEGLKGLSDLRAILAAPILADVKAMATRDGRIYYLTDTRMNERRLNDQVIGYRFKYLVDGNLTQTEASISADQMSGQPSPAPQGAMVKDVARLLDSFKGRGWETFYLDLVDCIRKQDKVDPILRCNLLKVVLTHAVEFTPYVPDRVKQVRSQVASEDADFAWMNPEDPDANRRRPQVQRVVAQVPPMAPFAAQVRQKLEGLDGQLEAPSMVGILLDASKVKVESTSASGKLAVLWSDGTGPAAYSVIGTVESGKCTVDSTAASRFPKLSPVFCCKGNP